MPAYECSAHLGLTGSHKLRTLYLLLPIEDHQQVRVDIQVDCQVVATLQHQEEADLLMDYHISAIVPDYQVLGFLVSRPSVTI